MELIKKGYTNISFKDGNLFKQEKILNGFNHNLDYSHLKVLDFVPKFISKDDQFITWEYIENEKFQISRSGLKQIAQNLKILHNSKLDFQSNFMLKRMKSFIDNIKKLNRWNSIFEQSWNQVQNIFKNDKSVQVPIHNDLYFSNILIDKNKKLWFVDWEYASLGNKYYDLALFVCATDINSYYENNLLDYYGVGDYYAYYQQKLVAYFFILSWALSKEVIPINDKFFSKKLQQWSKILFDIDELRSKNYKKIIFVDLDGTTLDTHNGKRSAASPQIGEFFEKLKNEDIFVVPCTGRGNSDITQELVKEVKSDTYILSNGGEIFIKDTQIFSSPLNKTDVDSILKKCNDFNCLALLKIDEDEVWYFKDLEMAKELQFFENTHVISHEEVSKQNVYQILLWNRDINVVHKLLDELKEEFKEKLNVHTSGSKDDFVELTDPKVSKGNAQKIFANLLDIDKLNTYHVGDSLNDASAKNNVNTLIAMQNSSPSLLKIADVKSEFSNKDAGIIKTIKKYCL